MSTGPGRTAIVDVQAFSPEESKRTLEGLKLKVTTAAQAIQSRDVAQGLVVRTNPPASTQVDEGSTVELVLSDGPPPKPLPPTTGGAYETVSKDLVTAGFGVLSPPINKKTADTTKKGTVSACTVTETKQPCGPKEKEGIVVQLEVLVMDATNGVPKVLNQTEAAAKNAITQAGLVPGAVTKKPSTTAPLGTVIEVKPDVGAQANLGSVVDIVISGGPPVTVPSVTGQTIAAARTTLTGLGLAVTPGLCKDTESVSSQTPTASSKVSKGDSVALNCSRCTTSGCIEIKTLIRSDLFTLQTK